MSRRVRFTLGVRVRRVRRARFTLGPRVRMIRRVRIAIVTLGTTPVTFTP